MSKIREDLVGVVTITNAGVSQHLRAGDPVPHGVDVDDALLEQGSRRRARTEPDPLSAHELDAARDFGFDVPDDADPEFVRGLIAGYEAGSSAAVAAAVSGAVAGPDDERTSTEDGNVPADSGTATDPGTGQPVVAPVDYDPGAEGQSVAHVLAELEKRSPAERQAIIAKERAGKARVGVLDSHYADEPAPPTS